MMKRPQYATMLRLSKICRWFAAIALVKICLLLALVLDFPLPELSLDFGSAPKTLHSTSAQHTNTVSGIPPVTGGADMTGMTGHDELQGAAAARAAAHTRPTALRSPIQMPAPETVTTPTPWNSALMQEAAIAPAPASVTMSAQAIGPASAPAPIVSTASSTAHAQQDTWWGNILYLTRLPVPRLGVEQAAQAASLDSPPPPDFTPRSSATSPFVPPAQSIPQAIPQGQTPDGNPIPPRSTTARPLPASSPAPLPAGQAGPQLNTPTNTLPPAMIPRTDQPVPVIKSGPLLEDPARQQQELARREQDVLVLKQQMEQRLTELQQTERKVQDMLKEAKALEDKKIGNLASIYVNMKPKQAAKAIESLDERIAVKILAGMTPKQSGDILTYTDPKKTAKLTELISRMRLEQQ